MSQSSKNFTIPADVVIRKDIKNSTFGFKVVESGGIKRLEQGTETDYRNAESIRLGIDPKDVELFEGCHGNPPRPGGVFSCGGSCATSTGGGNQTCHPDVNGSYWYCRCS